MLKKIAEAVCIYHEIKLESLYGKSRIKELIKARQHYCYIAKKNTNYSLQQIGLEINKNHATVISSINKAEIFKMTEPKYKSELDTLEQLIKTNLVNDFDKYVADTNNKNLITFGKIAKLMEGTLGSQVIVKRNELREMTDRYIRLLEEIRDLL